MEIRAPESRFARSRTALGLDEPLAGGILLLLWGTTAAFVAAHLTHKLIGAPWHPFFNLGAERGYAELFFQMLTGWSVLLLAIAATRRRAPILIAFAAFSAYLLADDYFQFHERMGTGFGQWFDREVVYLQGLATHLGEALYLGAVGLAVVVVFAIAYRLARRDARRMAVTGAVLYGALAFFGVAVDIVHAPFIDAPVIDPIFIALEDGGEIAVMALIVTYSLSLAFGRRDGTDATGSAAADAPAATDEEAPTAVGSPA
ncbi:hypothetical protein [Agromyces sp. C10]|uniref:hypothetical protein n=1 Tax=Agromyces sp. C10 TaxID=2935077 RepID=UPI00200A08F2|nr:hypothetical protein [Agromyces sp. C10]MCK8609735.1 hypothetical protein [Agromyces sp. C10]